MDKIEKVSVNGQVYELAGSGGGSVTPVSITYSELAALKNSNSLVAGARYRITDYTAIFKSWKSAGHQFDIVVEAVSKSVLSEKASAMFHEGDDYFTNVKLEVWEVWYSIDNDTERFSEASDTGKGFIYRLIDEHKNDVNYDFKNALFTVTAEDNSAVGSGSLDLYTFSYIDSSSKAVEDGSVTGKTFNNNHVDISYRNGVCIGILYTSMFKNLSKIARNEIYSDVNVIVPIVGIFENNKIYSYVTTDNTLYMRDSIVYNTNFGTNLSGKIERCTIECNYINTNGHTLRDCKFSGTINLNITSDIKNSCIYGFNAPTSGTQNVTIDNVDNSIVTINYNLDNSTVVDATATIINLDAESSSSLFSQRTLPKA